MKHELYSPYKALIWFVENNDNKKEIKLYNIENNEIKGEIPFPEKTLQELYHLTKKHKKEKIILNGYVGKKLIYINGNKMIWFVESKDIILHFSEFGEKKIRIPNLIFSLEDSLLKVFATKKTINSNFNEETILYNAPFLNVNELGVVCMGNVDKKLTTNDIKSTMILIENRFFFSRFTETHHNKLIKGNIIDYINGDLEFSNKLLIRSNLKLKDI